MQTILYVVEKALIFVFHDSVIQISPVNVNIVSIIPTVFTDFFKNRSWLQLIQIIIHAAWTDHL